MLLIFNNLHVWLYIILLFHNSIHLFDDLFTFIYINTLVGLPAELSTLKVIVAFCTVGIDSLDDGGDTRLVTIVNVTVKLIGWEIGYVTVLITVLSVDVFWLCNNEVQRLQG